MTVARTAPRRIALAFLLLGGGWVYLSDLLIARYASDPAHATWVSIGKGWLFIAIAAGLLYWFLKRYLAVLRESEQALATCNLGFSATEASLRRSHRQFVALVDSIDGIVWECDPATFGFTFVSRRAGGILGYPVEQWLAEPAFWEAHIHPDDRSRVRDALVESAEEGTDQWIEYRFLSASGRTVWVRNNITVTAEDDGRKTLRGVMYDITSQKRVEEDIHHLNRALEQRVSERTAQLEGVNRELRAIFRALPDVFLRLDRDGTILDFKAGFSDNCFSSHGDIVGRNIRQILPERAAAQFEEDLRLLPARGLVSFEYVNEAPGGENHHEARLLSLGESQIIVLIRNITERHRAEEEIRQLNDDLRRRACQLEAINQELESFSYSVSHDLRAPLRHIDGFSRALQEDCGESLDPTARGHLQRVLLAARRMGELIDDMLKLASVTRSDLVRQPVDLSAVARGIAHDLRQSRPDRQATFLIHDGTTAWGDPHLLRVVLENLLGNAWKYTGRKEEAVIEFGGASREGEPCYFVRDNGAGFDMEYGDKLFTAFQRLHGVDEFEGSGIGLATVQRVIRRHGGRVWGEGAVGTGAVFYFTLGQNDTGGAWKRK